MEWPILKHYQAIGETVTCECYCAVVTDELQPAICTKQREQLLQSVILWQKYIACVPCSASVSVHVLMDSQITTSDYMDILGSGVIS